MQPLPVWCSKSTWGPEFLNLSTNLEATSVQKLKAHKHFKTWPHEPILLSKAVCVYGTSKLIFKNVFLKSTWGLLTFVRSFNLQWCQAPSSAFWHTPTPSNTLQGPNTFKAEELGIFCVSSELPVSAVLMPGMWCSKKRYAPQFSTLSDKKNEITNMLSDIRTVKLTFFPR